MKNEPITYTTWRAMRSRCHNKNDKTYSYYGGRGIKICQRWLDSYQHFLDDMGERPSREYTIDRIDGNGNYEPSNCRWATRQEQTNNSNKQFGERNGSTHLTNEDVNLIKYSLLSQLQQKDLAKMFNVDPSTISGIKSGRRWKYA